MSSALGSPEPGSAGNVAASKPSIPDYDLVRIVGRGSYGDVWLARSVTGAWRAVKVVWRERFANAEPFECEFRGLKEFAEISLGESSQMALLHVGRNDAAGFFYYVMELADDAERGRAIDPAVYVPLTLAEMRTRRGRIPADECARFGAEVARVLASLHRRGFVHRDVKPSNIILVSGVPKLADVGLVAAAATAQTFVGTEGYVPPEGPGSPSADAFALGKLLYELSTGHDRQEFPKLPADLARFPDRDALLELNEIIVRACGPTRAERYRDGAAMLADLTALNAGASLRTRRLTAFLLRVAVVLGVIIALAAGGWFWSTRAVVPPAPIVAGVSRNAVAVLPLVNVEGDASQDYFSDGISDEILHALERERDLRVTGSRSAFSFKDRKLPGVEIAKTLRVANLVEGTLQRVGTRIRVEVRLTRAGDGVSERIGTFEREVSEVFALVNEIARAVAEKILSRVTMPDFSPSTKNLEAYDAFLRGRAMQVQIVDRSPAAQKQFLEATKHFERAVELDPEFAIAWARLAQARHYAGGIQNVHGTSSGSPLPTAERALALQPDLALAWSVRGFIVGVGQAESAAGLRDLFRAEELGGPNAETRLMRFLVTWFAGEARGLLPLAREAVAANPENVERIGVVQGAMAYLGDYAEADRLYQQTNSSVARIQLRQNWRGSEAALRLAQRLPDEPNVVETRARLLAALGRVSEAEQTVESLKTQPTWEVYADIGNAERARELAVVALPALRKRLQDLGDVVLTDTENSRRDQARAALVAAEIAVGNREAARVLLEGWRRETEKRTPNRRSGGVSVRLPRFYAQLGETEIVLSLLRQGIADGRNPGYELRDIRSYAALQEDPRFRELRRPAEAWAASQPDPSDDTAAPLPSSSMSATCAPARMVLLVFGVAVALCVAAAAEQEDAPSAERSEKTTTDRGEAERLEPFMVEAGRVIDEMAVAANAQRSAANIISVLSTTEFGPFVDSNPGEFLKYLPGVDVEPVAPGFNRYSVHGLGPENTEILFDGLPLANIHGERVSRRFDVSLVSAADIARAEVRKLPMPSDSANSLGGTINLIRRSAFDTSRRRITYQAWMRSDAQELTTEPIALPGGQELDRWRPNWQITWTEPVTRNVGFSVSLGQEDLLLSTQLSSPSWNLGTAANNVAAAAAVAEGRAVPAATSVFNPALRSALLLDAPQQQRKDYALARFDWRPREELTLTVDFGVHDSHQREMQSLYQWTAAREIAGTSDPTRGHGANHTMGQPGVGSISHNGGSWRESNHVTTLASLGAKWKNDEWELSAKVGWSQADFSFSDISKGYFGSTTVGSVAGLVDIPNTGVGFQTANPLPLTLDFHHDYWGLKEVDAWSMRSGVVNPSAPDFNVPIDWQSNEVVRIGGARSRPGQTEEILTNAKVYARRQFAFTAPTSLQFGLDWSEAYLNRRYDYHAWRFVGADGQPYSPDDSAVLISGERRSNSRDSTYDYPKPEPISVAKLYALYQDHPTWFRYDAARSERLALTTNSAYELTEQIAAPYVEFETRVGRRLKLMGGIRYERTTAKARGLLVDNRAAYLRYADGSTVHVNDVNPASTAAGGRLVVNLGTPTAVNYTLVNGLAMLPTQRAGAPVFTAAIQTAGNGARAAGETTDTDTNLGRGTLAHTRAVYRAKGAVNEAVNEGWFPGLHGTYEFSRQLVLQAGYARTQGRIEYLTALLPNNQVSDDLITSGVGAGAIGRITLQNPNLQPWTADNFETRLSWNPGRSLIALGAFRKQIQNFQPQVDTPPLSAGELADYAARFPDADLGPEYEGYSLRYRTNGGIARLDGAEIELRTPLDEWLPGWTRNFDLTCSATYLNRQGANGDELGANRAWIGAANLRYARGDWAIRVGYRYNGEQIVNPQLLSNNRSGQIIREPQHVFDATIEYTITRGLRVFIAAANLTNELSVDEQRFPDKPAYANLGSSHNIGSTVSIGLSGTF